MKYLMILALITCSFLTNTVQATVYLDNECAFDSTLIKSQRIYVGAIAGGSIPQTAKHNSKGYYVGAVAGYKFLNGIRGEVEISYSRADFKKSFGTKGHFHYWSYMANALYDFTVDLPFTPYLGVGVGYAHAKASFKNHYLKIYETQDSFTWEAFTAKAHAKDDSFVWQVIAGAKTEISKGLELGVDYRFVTFENFNKGRGHVHKVGLVLTQAF